MRAAFKAFNNLKIGTRILTGYIFSIGLMVIISVLAVIRLDQLNTTVADLTTRLVQEQQLAEALVIQVYRIRYDASRYILAGQQRADLDLYNQDWTTSKVYLSKAAQATIDPERTRLLILIKAGFEEFDSAFSEIAALLGQRTQIVDQVLGSQAAAADEKLDALYRQALQAGDLPTLDLAGQARDAFDRMRMDAASYLTTVDERYPASLEQDYQQARGALDSLYNGMAAPQERALAAEAQAAAAAYYQGFQDVRELNARQRMLIDNKLDVYGPEIHKTADSMVASLQAEYEARQQATAALVERTRLVLVASTLAAAALGLGFAVLISRAITNPLKQVAATAADIAAGDLGRRVEIHSQDEVGALVQAFNYMTAQLSAAIETLEERVKARTAALEAQTEELEAQTAELEAQTEELRAQKDALIAIDQQLSQDILARQAIEAELRMAKETAETASRAKSEFLANMSHELRTPLNGILGYTQILKRGKDLTPLQRDGLNIIQQSGEHLLTLINDILDLSKIEARRLELNPSGFHLPNFLNTLAGIIRVRAEQKHIAFLYKPSPRLPSGVQADEQRLRQVLLNLLGNAVKFTDQGQVVLRVALLDSPAPPGMAALRFEVQDTGIGMTPAQLEKLFVPFEQVSEAARRAEGTGLGLAISRRLVQLMGSDLQVTSAVEQGSCFWFDLLLPLTVDLGAEPAPLPDVVGYLGPRRKVLVVDDKSSNRELLVTLLAPLGFEVSEAPDGRQAVDLALALHPDLILMDVVMPVMTGIEATQEIRRLPELHGVVIICVSASVFDFDQRQIMLAGSNAFLSKPVNLKRLLDLLQQHLGLEWELETPVPVPQPGGQDGAGLPPPPAELEAIMDLVLRGNMIAIQERAASLESQDQRYAPFAGQLRRLAKAFDEDALVALLEKCISTARLPAQPQPAPNPPT